VIELEPFSTIRDRYYIVHNGIKKGIIDYVIDEEGGLFIQMIKVYEEHRREGIGRATMEYIKEKYSNKVIYGDSLPKSIEFWKAIGVTFTGKPEYKTRRDDLVHFVM
jgi:GNAT superfamily N-acetyltransferase